LNDARRRLLWPTRASLDDGVLTPYCVSAIHQLITRLNNTNEPHLIASGLLQINAGQTTYGIDAIAPAYSKARYLYTEDDGGDAYQRRVVELVSLESLTEVFGGGDKAGAIPQPYYNVPQVPRAASVYYDPSQGNMLEVAPVPLQDTTLRFTYEPVSAKLTSKQDVRFHLPQFDELVGAMTALPALPHCQWRGLTENQADKRYDRIERGLLRDIGSPELRTGLSYLFWQYSLTSFQKSNDKSVGYLQGVIY
jgi:hypothetical protein